MTVTGIRRCRFTFPFGGAYSERLEAWLVALRGHQKQNIPPAAAARSSNIAVPRTA
jgi:hypothetical protein